MNVVSPEMHRKPSAALSRCWASFAYCLQHKLNSSYETHSIVCMGACLGTKIHCSVNTRFIEFIFQMQVTFSLSCQLVCSVQSASLWHTFTHWIYFQCNYFIVVMQIMSSSCQRSFRSSSLSFASFQVFRGHHPNVTNIQQFELLSFELVFGIA